MYYNNSSSFKRKWKILLLACKLAKNSAQIAISRAINEYRRTVKLQKCLHRMMSYHYSDRCWCLTLSVPADHIVIGTQLTIETLRFVNLLQLKFAVNTKYSSFINH
jgi:hypothetical protein